MKVSIITVVYNGAATIRHCIESVLSQNFDSIEYIIVDGKSNDGSMEIIESFGSKIAKLISEPDKGIYDAMNKGIKLATGDVIGLLNADDFYADKTIISEVAQAMSQTNADGCYGDLNYVDGQNEAVIKRNWVSGEYKKNSFLMGWMPPHPAFFVKKKCYDQYGDFRLDMGSAADYEIMLRFIFKNGIKLTYIPKVLVKMRTGGVSNSTLNNRIEANKNDRKAWQVNGLKPRFFTLWLKPVRKIVQFI
ncbi:glycosyltransferase family 2 protein [Dyadobacter frigoris]|uniref:Glycosyltransferase n=1 Tax=Dyadobacter frigoris TaxID=2576211 RepID=A0A4U6CZ88_9BACT|nr:glycosyltransferase family 2 protein [Dyadobacter frigoris]TKT90149.1 glycosyltransferase [Dyadobacter frigoris]GLU52380.1 glycosyl transferase [Dyadobacter frigoris]